MEQSFKSWLIHFIAIMGLKQREVAQALRVTETAVSCWMKGKHAPANTEVVKIRLRRAFASTAEELGIDIESL